MKMLLQLTDWKPLKSEGVRNKKWHLNGFFEAFKTSIKSVNVQLKAPEKAVKNIKALNQIVLGEFSHLGVLMEKSMLLCEVS